MLHEELSGAIIGSAMAVLNDLGPGLDERVYENAMVVEFRHRAIGYAQQSRYPVHYRGEPVGTLIPDLIVAEAVIVDTKVVSAFTDRDIAQVLGYLAITGLKLGLLLNFRNHRLEWKRIVRDRNQPAGNGDAPGPDA